MEHFQICGNLIMNSSWPTIWPTWNLNNTTYAMKTVHYYQLAGVLRPGQIAHLWPSINTLQWPASDGVPESDTSVCRAAAAGQQTVLMGWPGYRLHSSKVLWVGLHRAVAAGVPDKQLVVVASWRQMLVIRRPLQTTHLAHTQRCKLYAEIHQNTAFIYLLFLSTFRQPLNAFRQLCWKR